MKPEEQLDYIIKHLQEKALIPFLKSLNEKERKELSGWIKILTTFISESRRTQYGADFDQFKAKAIQKQFEMLGVASFACMNRKDFEKLLIGSQIVNRESLAPVLEWYCPPWFGDYLNGLVKPGQRTVFGLNYMWLMELAEMELVQPVPELVANLLPRAIYDFTNRPPLFKPENALVYPQTLQEHIWYLFQYPSLINADSRYYQFTAEQQKEGTGWDAVLKKFSAEGILNRRQLLQETILATTRNFDKPLSAWFATLLLQLEPSTEELLEHQKDLFNMFNSPPGKVVSTALQCCKKIIESNAFDVQMFLDYIPLLLASDSKAQVSSALQLLDKLAKKYADKREQITELACQALIHKEEDIQTKAAKLILKYGAATPLLQDTVTGYTDTLFANARTLLQDFIIPMATGTEGNGEAEPEQAVSEKAAIPDIHNTDELVFLASQAFDNNEPVHFDQLPAALIALQHELRGDVISRLEPALQRAYKILTNDWRSNTGFLDHLLATFFINYVRWLVKEYPLESAPLAVLQKTAEAEEDTLVRAWQTNDNRAASRFGTLKDWKMYDPGTLYNAHRHLLQTALHKLQTKNPLPLLSTPTHYPAWINACTLIDRLQLYQTNNAEPDAIDFQVAISRCDLHDTTMAVQYAKEKLTGEYLRVISFLLNKGSKPAGPFTHEFLWMTAALAKTPHAVLYGEFDHFYYKKLAPELLTGQYRWSSFVEHYFEDKYTYTHGKMKREKVPATREVLDVQRPEKKEPAPLGFLSKLFSHKKENQPLIYEWLTIKRTFLSPESNDIKRLLSLIPNNPEPLLAQVVHHCLRHSVMQGEGDKKMVNAALEMTLNIWNEPGEMAHLFVATAMICSDKTAASFAAEIWISGVQSGTINSSLVGSIIGKHESIELAPLKRFTDLVVNRMFRISSQHNKALENMLAACIKELPVKPITNLKKLLEIYLELLSVNRTAIPDQELIAKASRWSDIPSLNKLVKSICGKASA